MVPGAAEPLAREEKKQITVDEKLKNRMSAHAVGATVK
jgi:hypothetical protein